MPATYNDISHWPPAIPVLEGFPPLMSDLKQITGIFVSALQQLNKSDGWAMASHISLSLMMAIFPFMIFCASLASYIGGPIGTQHLTELMFKFWPDEIATPMAVEMNTVLNTNSAGLLTFGVSLTLFFASNGVEAIRTALERAYQDWGKSSVIWQRLQSILFVSTGGGLMLIVSIILIFIPLINTIQRQFGVAELEVMPSSDTLATIVAFALLIFVVFACHRWLPGSKRPAVELWPGILVTLVLWTVATQCFSLYLRSMANYSAIYAGLAGVMSAQIFLYLVAVIFIYGAELNAALWRARVST